ncbi:PAS domain-containing protein [Anaerolineales bacterium HSG24]|nr:PAS domain-containing protein [Anaerolineales bacterium HSG24]
MANNIDDIIFTDNDELEFVFDDEEIDLSLLTEKVRFEVKTQTDPVTSSSSQITEIKLAEGAEWKVLVIDDDHEVHAMTEIALRGFTFSGKPLNLISAYSGKEAQQLIDSHPDAALILLDVVMEEKDSGLQVVKYIREEIQNQLIRIILRTGQPGEAPEESVIVNYNINDYKTKTELTHRKLFTTMIATLRSYQDVMTIEANRRRLADQAVALQQEIIIRKQVEEALLDTMERIRLITNAVPALISYVDSEQRYQFANKQYEIWYGMPTSEIEGMHIKEFAGQATYEQIQESIELALWGEEVNFETILPIKGEKYSVQVTYVPHFDKDGQTLGFFSLTQGLPEAWSQ